MADSKLKLIQARLPSLIVSGLALYFTVAFGWSGAKALYALQIGVPDVESGTIAEAIVNAFALAPQHLTTIAAALGAAKLAIAGFFLLAVLEGSSTGADGGAADRDALDLALHGAIAMTLLLLLPSWIGDDNEAVRTHSAHLMLLFVTVGASMFDRGPERETTRSGRLNAGDDFLPGAGLPLPTGKGPLV